MKILNSIIYLNSVTRIWSSHGPRSEFSRPGRTMSQKNGPRKTRRTLTLWSRDGLPRSWASSIQIPRQRAFLSHRPQHIDPTHSLHSASFDPLLQQSHAHARSPAHEASSMRELPPRPCRPRECAMRCIEASSSPAKGLRRPSAETSAPET